MQNTNPTTFKTAKLAKSITLQAPGRPALWYMMDQGDEVIVITDDGRLAYVKVSANTSQTYPILSDLLIY